MEDGDAKEATAIYSRNTVLLNREEDDSDAPGQYDKQVRQLLNPEVGAKLNAEHLLISAIITENFQRMSADNFPTGVNGQLPTVC
jgi:hypothetical protein